MQALIYVLIVALALVLVEVLSVAIGALKPASFTKLQAVAVTIIVLPTLVILVIYQANHKFDETPDPPTSVDDSAAQTTGERTPPPAASSSRTDDPAVNASSETRNSAPSTDSPVPSAVPPAQPGEQPVENPGRETNVTTIGMVSSEFALEAGALGTSVYTEDASYRADVTSASITEDRFVVGYDAYGPDRLRTPGSSCLLIKGNYGTATVYPIEISEGAVDEGRHYSGELFFR